MAKDKFALFFLVWSLLILLGYLYYLLKRGGLWF